MKTAPVRLKIAATILGDLVQQAGPSADLKAEATRALAAADALIEASGFDASAADADAQALADFTREMLVNARPVMARALASVAASCAEPAATPGNVTDVEFAMKPQPPQRRAARPRRSK